ncbi:MAG: DMT family transporter [Bacteroidales bacterium]
MTNFRKGNAVYLSISVSVLFWGLSFLWSNYILQEGISVFTLMFLRMSLAAVVISIVSFSLRKVTKIDKGDWGWFLLLVLLEPFLYFIGESFGLKNLNSPSISSVIISTIPIFTLIAGIYLYKERVSTLNIVGMILTLPGIAMMVFEREEFTIERWIGILFLILAIFSAVGYSLLVKKLAHKYNSYTIVTYQHLLAALYFLPLFLIFDFPHFSISMITPKIAQSLFFLSLFCSGLSFFLFINAVRILGVAKANIFTAIVPVISGFASFLIGKEPFSTIKVIGVIVVVVGVIIAQRPVKREQSASSSNLLPKL